MFNCSLYVKSLLSSNFLRKIQLKTLGKMTSKSYSSIFFDFQCSRWPLMFSKTKWWPQSVPFGTNCWLIKNTTIFMVHRRRYSTGNMRGDNRLMKKVELTTSLLEFGNSISSFHAAFSSKKYKNYERTIAEQCIDDR